MYRAKMLENIVCYLFTVTILLLRPVGEWSIAIGLSVCESICPRTYRCDTGAQSDVYKYLVYLMCGQFAGDVRWCVVFTKTGISVVIQLCKSIWKTCCNLISTHIIYRDVKFVFSQIRTSFLKFKFYLNFV